jgi:hypothetical protein
MSSAPTERCLGALKNYKSMSILLDDLQASRDA